MEHKLQIEFIYKGRKWFSRFINSEIIQTRPFKIGFKFENIGDNPIKGLSVSNIGWGSANGQNIFSKVDKSFHLDVINPGETKKIWVDTVGTYMHGLCSVNLSIKTDNGNTIKTFQKDPFTSLVTQYDSVNQWMDFFFIRSKNEYEQSNLNSFLVFLTTLSLALTFVGVYLVYQTQYLPQIYTQQKNNNEARKFCLQNPASSWPSINGDPLPCDEILKILEISTSTKNK